MEKVTLRGCGLPDGWQERFDKRFTMDTDNGSGPEFLFRDNGDGTRSIALGEDVKAFIRVEIELAAAVRRLAREPQHKNSPTEALIAAMERADDMENVLVIWDNDRTSCSGSFDSGLTLERALYLVEFFKAWMLKCACGDGDR